MNLIALLSESAMIFIRSILASRLASSLFYSTLYLTVLYALMFSLLGIIYGLFDVIFSSAGGANFFQTFYFLARGVGWVMPNLFAVIIAYIGALYIARFTMSFFIKKLELIRSNPFTS